MCMCRFLIPPSGAIGAGGEALGPVAAGKEEGQSTLQLNAKEWSKFSR